MGQTQKLASLSLMRRPTGPNNLNGSIGSDYLDVAWGTKLGLTNAEGNWERDRYVGIFVGVSMVTFMCHLSPFSWLSFLLYLIVSVENLVQRLCLKV